MCVGDEMATKERCSAGWACLTSSLPHPPRLPHSPPRPFLLRRIKTDVETSLPSKKEILLYAQMTPLQKKLDKQLRDKTLQVRARA